MTNDVGYVYAIKNKVNSHMYIGSTTNYKSRWHTHRSSLRHGKHHSFILQKAWDKYGAESFEFNLLLICPKDQRIDYETRLMPLQNYNVMRTPKESFVRGGWNHSDEFKAKISAVHKGKKLTEEHCKKLSEHRMGRIESDSFKEKARLRQLGVSPSSITRNKLSASIIQARSKDVENSIRLAKIVHAQCLQGKTTRVACKDNGITPSTFYKYVALLKLPMLGKTKRGAL